MIISQFSNFPKILATFFEFTLRKFSFQFYLEPKFEEDSPKNQNKNADQIVME
jgi:hypothetical protein